MDWWGPGRVCGIRLSADQRAGGEAAVPAGDDGVCLTTLRDRDGTVKGGVRRQAPSRPGVAAERRMQRNRPGPYGQKGPVLPFGAGFDGMAGRKWRLSPLGCRIGRRHPRAYAHPHSIIVEKHVENCRIYLEISGFLRTFAVRKKSGASKTRC